MQEDTPDMRQRKQKSIGHFIKPFVGGTRQDKTTNCDDNHMIDMDTSSVTSGATVEGMSTPLEMFKSNSWSSNTHFV